MDGLFTQVADPLFTGLTALALAIARPLGILSVLPVFTRMGLTRLLRNGVALALALPLLPTALGAVVQQGPGFELVALIAKEVAVGLILGTAVSVVFWAAETAGGFLDFQRGTQSAFLIDPLALTEASILGTLFVLVLITVFFAGNGFLLLSGGFYGSYGIWPLDGFAPHFDADLPVLLLGLLDDVFQIALLLAAPVLILLVVTDLALGAITRFTPQLNAFDLSLSVKSAVAILVLPVYTVFLIDYMREGLTPFAQALQLLSRVMP